MSHPTNNLEPDLKVAAEFLQRLDPEDVFTFQTFAEGTAANGTLSKVLHGTLPQHAHALLALQSSGAGVFVMVNQGDGIVHGNMKTCRTKASVQSVRALFVDLDGTPLPDNLDALKPDLVIESSPGKWHIYWLVQDCPKDLFGPIQVQLAAKLGGDVAVKDLPRVMRIPGFFHLKATPFQTRIAQNNRRTLPIRTLEDLSTLLGFQVNAHPAAPARAPRSNRADASAGRNTQTGPLTGAIPESTRNNTLASLAGSLRRQGMDAAQIDEVLQAHNVAHCVPPLDADEVSRIAESIGSYPPGPTPYPQNDTGNADRFRDLFVGSMVYVHGIGWHHWNGFHWYHDDEIKPMACAKAVGRAIHMDAFTCPNESDRKALFRHANSSQNLSRITSMIEMAKNDAALVIPAKQIDNRPMLLGVANGVIDLSTGQLRAADRMDWLTRHSPVCFDPQAICPHFDGFIDSVTCGDTELAAYLQRVVGYTLTGSTSEQCLFFLYGSGANGKSTFLNIVKELLGSQLACQAPPEMLASRRSGSPTNDLARLKGPRMVVANEIESGSLLAENLVKQLTGGDCVSARFLHREFFDFHPVCKLFIAGNHKPVVRGTDEGIWRRLRTIPFAANIPAAARDRHLFDKLKAELPGILKWAIAGCRQWQHMGLNEPQTIRDAVTEYRNEMDVIGQWIEECCECAPQHEVGARDAYRSYSDWAKQSGYMPMASGSFGRELVKRFKRVKRREGNFYIGLGCR